MLSFSRRNARIDKNVNEIKYKHMHDFKCMHQDSNITK